MTDRSKRMNPKIQALLRGLAFPLVVLPGLLLLAGRLDYWQAWVYLGVNLVLLAVNYLLLRGRPDLMQERLKAGEGTKWWDRIYFAITTPLYFAALILAALDGGRFGWSPRLGAGVYVPAYLVYLAGQGIFLWAKATNRFFATVVRIQTDRGQTVCDQGPYRAVRHPGYAGGILFELATPLLLGSLWGLIPQGIGAILLVVRTWLEDRTLRRELPGYGEYAERVKYRLVPGLW